MNRDDVTWRGYWPAAPTPFTACGELSQRLLSELVELYISQGVHGVLINGTTGEWFSQSAAERAAVASWSVEAADRRVPIVVGCTGYTPDEVISLAQDALAAGADGLLATPPPYAHLSEREIAVFYETVTSAVAAPWMVYNWPRGVAVDMSADLLSDLADLPNVVAIKNSTGDWMRMLDSLERVHTRVRFFGSFVHPRGLAILRGLGGDGAIDGGGIGAPWAVPFFNAVFDGDWDTAMVFAKKYAHLVGQLVNSDYSAKFSSPTTQLKAAMALLDQPGGAVRAPLVPLPRAATEELRRALANGGLPVESLT